MLQGRLTPHRFGTVAVALVLLSATACSGDDSADDTIPEIELTRVTAVPGSDAEGQVACTLDASHLRSALEAYRLDHGEPAPDEAALVDEGYIMVASSLWNVVAGELVAEDPACEGVPSDLAATEIVTGASGDDRDALGEELATVTPDDVLADLTDAELDSVGGVACAREVAEASIAYQRWLFDHDGADPAVLTDLVDEGYLGELALWRLGPTALDAIDGSGCIGPIDVVTG